MYILRLTLGRFFDCTDKEMNLISGVPAGLARREALVLDDKSGGSFVTVPEYPVGSSEVSSQRSARDRTISSLARRRNGKQHRASCRVSACDIQARWRARSGADAAIPACQLREFNRARRAGEKPGRSGSAIHSRSEVHDPAMLRSQAGTMDRTFGQRNDCLGTAFSTLTITS